MFFFLRGGHVLNIELYVVLYWTSAFLFFTFLCGKSIKIFETGIFKICSLILLSIYTRAVKVSALLAGRRKILFTALIFLTPD